jgi:hypothetical protein
MSDSEFDSISSLFIASLKPYEDWPSPFDVLEKVSSTAIFTFYRLVRPKPMSSLLSSAS